MRSKDFAQGSHHTATSVHCNKTSSRRYIFLTGGVLSSLGKGLTLASIALLFEKKGYRLALLKLDPYLNVDPGTMNPFEHGEVYVTEDGTEADLDLGHYYRYSQAPLSKVSTATSGQIYDTIIKRERRGDYLGKTVQIVPHITDEIKSRILRCGAVNDADIVLVEIGGTTGDIESLPFLEAVRQFRYEHAGNCLNLHMAYVPYLNASGELKTKPAQHSVKMLGDAGIIPDFMLCRSEKSLPQTVKEKIALFCRVSLAAVFDVIDVATSIYELPLMLHQQGVVTQLCARLRIASSPIDLTEWERIVQTVKFPQKELLIGIVGKYSNHKDAYKSVVEALHHSGIAEKCRVEIVPVPSDDLADLSHYDGCVVPGGFGKRGFEEKVAAAQFCREHKIPYLGICLGMQAMVVEFLRNVVGLHQANSKEIDPSTPHPIFELLRGQEAVTNRGGTMRLGAYVCSLKEGTKAYAAYAKKEISERHRHRYEFNYDYLTRCEERGLVFSGFDLKQHLGEIAEVVGHPWMLGVQFHPEFQSRPTSPHPLFSAFIQASLAQQRVAAAWVG